MSLLQTALIVDDNEPLADTLARALRGVGFDTRTAHNGQQGYSSFFRNPTDWVITDIEMPDITGIEMMRCIRGVNPAVRTIYMTGAVDQYGRVLNQEARQFAAKVLSKPFDLNRLVEQMKNTQDPALEPAIQLCRSNPAPRAFWGSR